MTDKILSGGSELFKAPFNNSAYEYVIVETHFRTRNYNQGRIFENLKFGVFCNICRQTKEVSLLLSRSNNTTVLVNFITTYIPHGASIFINGWKGYTFLNILSYVHYVVNHPINFVNRDNNNITHIALSGFV